MFDAYQACPYVEGARGPFNYDCWGLLRTLLINHSQVPEEAAPMFGGITRDCGMHESFEDTQTGFVQIDSPEKGAAVCAFNKDNVLHHCGYFFEGGVIHTTSKRGVRLDPLNKFARYGRLEFYVYR